MGSCLVLVLVVQRNGSAVPCYVSMLLDDAALETKDQSVDNQRDFDIRWTANSLYAGERASFHVALGYAMSAC